jgi:cysteine desulfurase/selenocysteine lyase
MHWAFWRMSKWAITMTSNKPGPEATPPASGGKDGSIDAALSTAMAPLDARLIEDVANEMFAEMPAASPAVPGVTGAGTGPGGATAGMPPVGEAELQRAASGAASPDQSMMRHGGVPSRYYFLPDTTVGRAHAPATGSATGLDPTAGRSPAYMEPGAANQGTRAMGEAPDAALKNVPPGTSQITPAQPGWTGAMTDSNMVVPMAEIPSTAMPGSVGSGGSAGDAVAMASAAPSIPAAPADYYFLPAGAAQGTPALSTEVGAIPATQQPRISEAQLYPGAEEGYCAAADLSRQAGMNWPGSPATAPAPVEISGDEQGSTTTIPTAAAQPHPIAAGMMPSVEPMAAAPTSSDFLDAGGMEKMIRDQYAQLSGMDPGLGVMPSTSSMTGSLPTGEPHLHGLPAELLTPQAASSPQTLNPETFYFNPVPAPPMSSPAPATAFDINRVRADFPILQERVHGKQLVWLDNAATTQKPQSVIDRLAYFYAHENSNIHRGAHTLAARATNAYEEAREKAQHFLGASSASEIIFVRGTTEAVNLVAQTYGRQHVGPGDEIVVTTLEHHSNIVPWQFLCQQIGARLRVVPVNDRGEVYLDAYENLLGSRTRIVAVTQVSNALGTILPVKAMTEMAHHYGARVLIDGAQGAPHIPVDVEAMGCDFYTLSGHKLFGPTGVGVLYGKRELLDSMPPWQGGGNMIDQVSFEKTTFNEPPAKFEAGTGILAGAVGLGAAIDYLNGLGMDNIQRYEKELMAYATRALQTVPGLHAIGTAAEKAGVLSFLLEGFRPEEVGTLLSHEGIAVRAGHHCAQPTMQRYGLTGTVRPSLAFYNTPGEIDVLVETLRAAKLG